ncbi:biotin/lipoyl-binding protein [Verrucomicrobiales bacterium]|nr:biotin/lipoyl-binding protein [Verrucomicrobiales bacterium]
MKPLAQFFFMVSMGMLLAGCGEENQFVPPPPPEVGVQSPLIKTATVYSEYAGRTSGSARVEIRARVTGFLKETHFNAGNFVKEGQLLFTIEPEQFEAAVSTAEGNLAKAKEILR